MQKNDTGRRLTGDQVTALLAANGVEINDEVLAYLEPLLSGDMDFAEHRTMLENLMNEATA